MPTLSHVRRTRGAAIAWTPTDQPDGALAGTPRPAPVRTPQLYLTQSVILDVDAHLRESTSPVPFGLLVGALCISPQDNLVYLLIDTVTRSRTELSESDPYAQLASELRSLTALQEKQGKLTIGWYLGGMTDDLSLDSDVRGLHRALFPEPRHVLLLRGAADGVEHGAFLRFDASSGNSYPIPFFELLPEREIRKSGERRTAIRWKEYRTNEPALPLSESEASNQRRDVAPPPRWGTRSLKASLETFRQGLRAPSREKPPAASAPTSAPPSEIAAEHARAGRGAEHQDQPSARTEDPATPVAEMPAVEVPGTLASAAPAPAAQQHPAATPLSVESEPLAHERSPGGELTSPRAEHVQRSPIASVEANGARRPPASDLQHIFIDGTLVPVRWTHRVNRKSRLLAAVSGVSIKPLLIVALVMLAVAALYRFMG